MKELERHRLAFEMYYEACSIPDIAERFGVSTRAVHKWKSELNWKERVLLRDQEIAKGVEATMMPGWVATKAELLQILIEQVKSAEAAGVVPTSTRDIVAAVKEIRSIMGESDALDVKQVIEVRYEGLDE